MAKFTDAIVTTLKGHFNAGDQPTEAQFAGWIDAIQQGIEEHNHDGTGDGDGVASIGITGITGAGVAVPEDWWIGIGAALERIVFNGGDGAVAAMGAKFGVGTLTPGNYFTNANQLVILQASANAGLTVITDTDKRGSLYFGDGVDAASYRGGVQYNHNEDKMHLWSVGLSDTPELTLYNGNIGINTKVPNQRLTIEGTMSLKEQAAASADTAAYGQLWVKNTTPCQLWFTDDTGTDTLVA